MVEYTHQEREEQKMDVKAFYRLLKATPPGGRVIYHAGPYLQGANEDTIAAVREEHDLGRVELLQRRIGRGDFEYLAVKRRQTRVPRLRFSQMWG